MIPRGLLKEYFRVMAFLVESVDLFIIVAAGWLTYVFRFSHAQMPFTYLVALASAVGVAFFLFPVLHLYVSVRSKSLPDYLRRIAQAVGILAILLAGLAFFTKTGEQYSRLWFGLWMVTTLILLTLFRCVILWMLRFMRTRGWNERRVVIVGAGDLGIKLAATMQQALWTGFRIVAFIDDNMTNKPSHIAGIPVLAMPQNMSGFLTHEGIDEVWLALPLHAEARVKTMLHDLRHHTITLRYVVDIFGLDLLNHSIMDLAGFPILNLRSTPMLGSNRVIKALEDRILAGLILLLISPLFLIIALAVKLSSSGPVFYKQKRVGWNGNEFEMLKFRSMPTNAEEASGPVWANSQDMRPTSIGKFLRRTSLDELPQFINVLKGDMSIVGPRPERKVFVEEFKEKIPRYMQKHMVKAGITGWAQVNGWRGDTSLEKRVEYDLYYIENWSFAFDLKIIFLTLFRGFVNKNAY